MNRQGRQERQAKKPRKAISPGFPWRPWRFKKRLCSRPGLGGPNTGSRHPIGLYRGLPIFLFSRSVRLCGDPLRNYVLGGFLWKPSNRAACWRWCRAISTQTIFDGADLSVWEQNYGSTVALDADADQDGDVDGADFLAWQRNFGSAIQTDKEHVIFITGGIFSINSASEPNPIGSSFGGLSSADFHCTQRAFFAGLLPGWNGTDRIYKALISTSSVNANERVFIEGRIVNTVGDIIADNEADFWDGTIDTAITYTEFGSPISFDKTFYTGSDAFGNNSFLNCQDWTQSSNQIGSTGASNATNSWFSQAAQSCDVSYRLVCISPAQDQPAGAVFGPVLQESASETIAAASVSPAPLFSAPEFSAPRFSADIAAWSPATPAPSVAAPPAKAQIATPLVERPPVPFQPKAALMPQGLAPSMPAPTVAPTQAPHATDWQADFDQALEALPERDAWVVAI